MKKQNGYTRRKIASLMSENVKKLVADIDKLALENPVEAIRIIHGQWREVCLELQMKSQS